MPNGFAVLRQIPRPAWAGRTNDLQQWANSVVERVRVGTTSGRIRFLPWYDPYTDETPEIRREYPKMLVESSVKAAFQTKVLAVISLPVTFNPPDDDDPRQQEAARFSAWAFRKIHGGTSAAGWSILHPAVIKGLSVCEKVWEPAPERSGRWAGRRRYKVLKSKDTDYLQLGIDAYRNVTAIKGAGFNSGRIWNPDDFVLFSYMSLFENPSGMSDFRAAYRPYWIKHTVWQLRSLHLDKFVGPYLKGTYSTQDQKSALEAALEAARASTWFTIPAGVMVDAIDMSMRGTTEFESCLKDCDREILIAIVGAHLQILEGQTSGARGNTQVHKETAELIQWWLADRLARVYYDQMVCPLIAENYHDVEPPEVSVGAVTEAAMIEQLKVDDGLQKLGWKLSSSEVGKRYARTSAADPEDVLTAAGQAAPTPAEVGADGQPAEAVASNDLRATVGGSQAIADLQKAYYAGQLPRDAAIGNATIVFGFEQVEAERLFPEQKPVKLSPDQSAQPAPGGAPSAPSFSESSEALKKVQAVYDELTEEERDGLEIYYHAGPPEVFIIDQMDWHEGEGAKKIGPVAEKAVGKDKVIWHNEQGAPDKKTWKRLGVGGAPAASPFSEGAVFCQEGKNKGLPGVCPDESGQQEPSGSSPHQGADFFLPNTLPKSLEKDYLQQLTDPDHATLLPPLRSVTAKNQPNPALATVHAQAFPPNLTTGEKVGMQLYSFGMDGPVNSALREGIAVPAAYAKANARLQSAFAKAPVLSQPVPTVRGMNLDPTNLSSFLHAAVAAQQSGEPVQLGGYTSTATGSKLAPSFAGNVELHIAAVHGLDMMPVSHFPQERELLLNHNSQFRITKVERTRAGTYKVHMEQVPPTSKSAAPVTQGQHKGKAALPDVSAEKLSALGKLKALFGFSETRGETSRGEQRATQPGRPGPRGRGPA